MIKIKITIFYMFILFQSIHAEPMTFKYVGNGGNGIGSEWVAAEGEITKDTPRLLEDFIESGKFYGSIVFNSPGGNLLAGLEIGRVLRKHKIRADIGDTVLYENGPWHDLKGGAICASACAFALLGATDRQVSVNELGFHQFYDEKAMQGFTKKQFSGNDRMWDQYITGVIVEYLLEMDIDVKLYSLISKTPPGEVHLLNRQELERFEINTDFKSSTPWTLKAYDKGLVAEIITRDVYKTVGRLYSTRNKKYYFTVIYNSKNMEPTYKHLKKIYPMFDLRFSTGDKEEYKILKTEYYLSKDKKRMSLVFQISKKTAMHLGHANRIDLVGYNSDGSYPARVYQPNFNYVSFRNVVGDKRLTQIVFKNPI